MIVMIFVIREIVKKIGILIEVKLIFITLKL